MNKFLALALLLAAAPLPLQAQTVWRCGADARNYSDRPCADGRPLQMADLADRRSAAEVQAAQDVAAREKRLVDELRRERLERERLSMPPSGKAAVQRAEKAARTDGISPKRPPNRPRPEAKRSKPADDGIWRAVAPSSRRTKD